MAATLVPQDPTLLWPPYVPGMQSGTYKYMQELTSTHKTKLNMIFNSETLSQKKKKTDPKHTIRLRTYFIISSIPVIKKVVELYFQDKTQV